MVSMKRVVIFILSMLISSSIAMDVCTVQAVQPSDEDLLDDEFFDIENEGDEDINDPLEPMNRFFFEINDNLYYWVIKPTNTVYSALFPGDVRDCFGNFFSNLATPISLLNNLLQGDFEDAGIVLSRFAINTTLGVFGFGDPAYSEFGLDPQPADFGQTLGKYGVGAGFYLYWPILGPSNLRDTIGYFTDVYTHPLPYVDRTLAERTMYYSAERLNLISLNPDLYDDMKKYSLDPYVAARQAYYDYRRTKIKMDGNQENIIDNF